MMWFPGMAQAIRSVDAATPATPRSPTFTSKRWTVQISVPRRGFRSVLRSSGNAARSRVLPGRFGDSHAPSRGRSSLNLDMASWKEPQIRRADRSRGAATRSWRESGDGPAAQCAAPDRGRTSSARTALSSKLLRSGRSRMGENYVLDGERSPRSVSSRGRASAGDGAAVVALSHADPPTSRAAVGRGSGGHADHALLGDGRHQPTG